MWMSGVSTSYFALTQNGDPASAGNDLVTTGPGSVTRSCATCSAWNRSP